LNVEKLRSEIKVKATASKEISEKIDNKNMISKIFFKRNRNISKVKSSENQKDKNLAKLLERIQFIKPQ
jgi:hypothetical protein